MVYPTLLATIGDVAQPSWRASSVGVYRLWRDLGYAVGALLSGLLADELGAEARGTVRLTLGRGTTAEDVSRAADALIASWRRTRSKQK